jgi:DNA-binding LacI/PurR family transcriptional regulator
MLLAPGSFAKAKIQAMIERGEYPINLPLPAERKIAEQIGVSRTPVAKALRELAEIGMIIKTSPRKYVVAPPIATGAGPLSDTVVFFNHSRRENWRTSPSIHRVESGVATSVENAKYNLLTISDLDKIEKSPEWVLQNRPIGIVVGEHFAGQQNLLPILRRIQDVGGMVVVNYDAPWLEPFERVVSDQVQGARDLALWLFQHGRKRILRLHLADESKYWIPMRDRGYEQAAAKAGFEVLKPVRMPLATLGKVDADTRQEQARRIAGGLSESILGWRQDFDAIMCSSDEYCGATALACEMLGLKPNRDVWLAGFDNTWDFFSHGEKAADKPLVTVDNQQREAGKLAVDILLRRASGQRTGPPQLNFVPTTIIPLLQEPPPKKSSRPFRSR